MPGTTALTVANEVLSSTAFAYMPEMRNMIDRDRPIVGHLMGEGLLKQSGGERVIIPWKTNRHTNTTRVVTGYEGFDDTVRPLGTPGHAPWAYVMRPVMISKRDRLINRGEAKQLDIMKERLKDTEEGLKQELEELALRGPAATGTFAPISTAWTDWLSLNGDDTATGFIEGQAAGTNSLHNVAKSSFTGAASFPGFHNAFGDAAGSFNTAGLTQLDAIQAELMDRVGSIPESLKGYISVSGAQHLKRSVRANEQYLNGEPGNLDTGRLVLVFNGMKLWVNGRMPSTGGVTSTSDLEWTVVFIDWNDIKLVGQPEAIFDLDEFETISGTRVQAAVMHLMGQLVCTSLAHVGLLVGGDTW